MRSLFIIAGTCIHLLLVGCAAHAELNRTQHALASCTLQVRVVGQPEVQAGPRFVMINGVPLSSAIYRKVAQRLQERLAATSYLIDLPGTGGSTLNGKDYSWPALRACIHSQLKELPPHLLVMDDIAPLSALPFPQAYANTEGLVILNAVTRPSEVHPPFPLSFLRCCPDLAVAVGSVTPRAIFLARIRGLGIARSEAVSTKELNSLYAEMMADGGLRHLANLMSGFALDEEADRAFNNGLQTPVPQLFIWGTADPVLGQAYKHLLPLSDNQQLVTYPDAKHFLMLDYPDEIADAISEWYTTKVSAPL